MANTLKFGNGNWATKENSTLAYSDQYDNFKPLPFDFTRASNATVVNKEGLIETVANGIPRIDFADSEDGALLLEPQRTNLIPNSQDIISGWSALRVSVQNNQTISPNGGLNAALSTATSEDGSHASFETLNGVVTAGNDYYISCFVKKSTTRYIRLNEGYVNDVVTFDLDTQTFVITQGSPTNVIFEDYGNGWCRIGYKFVANSTGNTQFALYINDNNNNSTYVGDGEAVYLWGVQIEEGSYPTSYIPTQGSAATRVLETCSQSGLSGIIGQTEGVIYCEFEIQTTGEDMVIMNVSNSATPANSMYFYLTSGNALQGYVDNSGTQVTISSGVLVEGTYKAALAYKANDFAFYLNGSLIGTDTSGTVPTCSVLRLENYTDVPTYQKKTKIAEAKLYNTRLSNSELAELTTI